MNKTLVETGRIIFAIPFLVFGINHFINLEALSGMYTTFIPLTAYTIILSGIAMIAAGISIMVRKYIRLSCSLLAGMLFIFIVTIHIPQLFEPDKTYHVMGLINLLKDVCLMGGSLMIIGLYPKDEKSEK